MSKAYVLLLFAVAGEKKTYQIIFCLGHFIVRHHEQNELLILTILFSSVLSNVPVVGLLKLSYLLRRDSYC